MKSQRCTGQCCRDFILWSGDQKIPVSWLEEWLKDPELSGEQRQVFEMVVPLEECEDEDGHVYTTFTCKNFDSEYGDCTIYETRPEMCRRYPREACNYDGCTLKDKSKGG